MTSEPNIKSQTSNAPPQPEKDASLPPEPTEEQKAHLAALLRYKKLKANGARSLYISQIIFPAMYLWTRNDIYQILSLPSSALFFGFFVWAWKKGQKLDAKTDMLFRHAEGMRVMRDQTWEEYFGWWGAVLTGREEG